MKFGMAISKRKRTGTAVVYGRPVIHAVAGRVIIEKSIVKGIWVLIIELKTARGA
jgi:hypothetical protein